MPSKLATASLLDNVRFNLFHVIPYLLRGIFTRNKRWVGWLGKFQRDPLSVAFLGGLREKHRCGFLALRMLNEPVLLVFDGDAVRHILDHSPDIYAETKGKRRGMSHFQPHALTISRGEEWKDRRAFNAAVLGFGGREHPCAERFLTAIREEIVRHEANGLQTWEDFSRLFEAIAARIIFGERLAGDGLMTTLHKMMKEANNVLLAGRKSKYLDGFYRDLKARLAAPAEHSLAHRCREVPVSELTRVENQLPHWMFAMGDTLAVNLVAALALICAHPWAEERVRRELDQHPPVSAGNIGRLYYLEGCLQEAMRLWPSTLMLMRVAVTDDHIGELSIAAGTQMLIHNGFNHRDRQSCSFADRFNPDFWLDQPVDYRFNHFSNGTQVCAGKDLALFVGKAVLAILLQKSRFVVSRPSLAAEAPMPHVFDHFSLRCERRALA